MQHFTTAMERKLISNIAHALRMSYGFGVPEVSSHLKLVLCLVRAGRGKHDGARNADCNIAWGEPVAISLLDALAERQPHDMSSLSYGDLAPSFGGELSLHDLAVQTDDELFAQPNAS